MRITTITIIRNDTTTIAQHILVQIDQASTKAVIEHLAFGDHHVGDMWKIITRGWFPYALMQRGDLLIDEQFTDADNSGGYPFRYRVFSRPKDYWLNHQECMADTAVGT